MEELEDPTEGLREKIQEEAIEKKEAEKWSLYVALSTAFMAVLAALSGMLGGHHSNEALIEQIKAADQWAYYQAKGIKSEITNSSVKIIGALNAKVDLDEDRKKIERYEKEKEQIRKTAEETEQLSAFHLHKHLIYSRAVTVFQIAIAIAAISILTKKKVLWITSMLLALAGIVFLMQGLIS